MSELRCTDASNIMVIGELTANSVVSLQSKGENIMASCGEDITVNLAQVSYASSAGVALLLCWLRNATAANKSLVFSNIPDCLHGLIAVSGLLEVIPTSDDPQRKTNRSTSDDPQTRRN